MSPSGHGGGRPAVYPTYPADAPYEPPYPDYQTYPPHQTYPPQPTGPGRGPQGGRGFDPRDAATGPTGPVRPSHRGPSRPPVAAAAIHASKVYGQGQTAVRALDDVSVQLPARRFTAIMGPSGSGKSTLMHCLAGLDKLTSGKVYVDGIELSALSERKLTKLRRDRVGFVFQAFNLVPTLTAYENITLPMSLARRRRDDAWVEAVVDAVGLQQRLDHRPAELSGGQQQRVAVARALASRPAIIFADEPTGNLDSRSGQEVLAFMRQAVERLGQTIVMVTHDPVAASYAHHALFLADGQIVDEVFQPTPERVLERLMRLS